MPRFSVRYSFAYRTCVRAYVRKRNNKTGAVARSAARMEPFLTPAARATESATAGNAAKETLAVSPARWWVLFIFCGISISQSLTWNIFSPIWPTVKSTFPSWSQEYQLWVINSANIAFLLCLVPTSVAIERIGPRRTTLLCALCIFLGNLCRIFALQDTVLSKVVHVIAMSLIGLGGTWMNFGGPILSDTWFPTHQRTMATAFASVATYIGAALGFIVGPSIVGNFPHSVSQSMARSRLAQVFYVETGVSGFFLLAACLYFPDRPKTPPSNTASLRYVGQKKQRFIASLGRYFKCKNPHLKYWLVSFAMAFPLGVFQAWGSSLYLCVHPLGVSKLEASWIGFLMTAIGCMGSVIVGALLDRFAGHLKTVAAFLLLSSSGALVVFCMNASSTILSSNPASRLDIAYVSSIIGGGLFNSAIPLFFEMIMELVFGWGDEQISSMLTILLNTVVQIIFLIVLAQRDAADSEALLWPSWLVATSMLVGAICLLFLRMTYRRLARDLAVSHSKCGSQFDRCGFL